VKGKWATKVTTADPFGSPKQTLARARHHIADLRSKADDFMKGRAPGTYRIERVAGGNKHTIKFDRSFFEQLSNVAFDAANNLRSALDQTAYATAILAGKEKPKRAYFPIACKLSDLENLIKRNCRDLRPEVIELFKTFKPYGRGNIWLSALSKLCNTQKHATLIPFKTGDHQVMYIMNGIALGLGHRWHPETFELEILGSAGADFTKGGGYFAFGITFTHDDPVIAGSEPAGLLDGAAIQVDRVINATEVECQRLGLSS
jgi:hypothetical protein